MKKRSQSRKISLSLGFIFLLFLSFCLWIASSTNAQEKASQKSRSSLFSNSIRFFLLGEQPSPEEDEVAKDEDEFEEEEDEFEEEEDEFEEEEDETDELELEIDEPEEIEEEAPVDVTKDIIDDDPPPAVVDFTPIVDTKPAPSDSAASIQAYTSGNGLESRKNADYGSSHASQNAVKAGLDWIARHQITSGPLAGSWNYNHCLVGNCNCGNPGTMMKCTNGATAMGILPFLGCGMTHKEGTYKTQVANGLKFLCVSMKKDTKCPSGGSLHQPQGTMYAHGLATICLTEAYAMTRVKVLPLP